MMKLIKKGIYNLAIVALFFSCNKNFCCKFINFPILYYIVTLVSMFWNFIFYFKKNKLLQQQINIMQQNDQYPNINTNLQIVKGLCFLFINHNSKVEI